MKTQRDSLEREISKTYDVNLELELTMLCVELDQFLIQLVEKFYSFINFVDDIISKQGLNTKRIQQFKRFIADESFVDDQCVICMGDVEVGRKMMRLDCDGQHTFCQVCIEGWFAEHNTCPICRHIFE